MITKTKTIKGRIIKGIGGFYYVDAAEHTDDIAENICDNSIKNNKYNSDADKNVDNGIYKCSARGKFRQQKLTPLVGDIVIADVDTSDGCGVVNEILPRSNAVLRPPVANVTQMAVIVAAANPRPSLYLTDKLLISAEAVGIDVVVCINKTDIDDGDELFEIYQKAGYKVIKTCAENGTNINLLTDALKDNITVFAGNSGVGKSSLLNRVTNTCMFETGEVSQKAERGKHTTRHTELVKLKNGGYIIDTPGFGTIDMTSFDNLDYVGLFREFNDYTGSCRFNDCRHIAEPDCGILNAVEKGKISKSRHESYVRMVKEAEEVLKRQR